MNSRSTLASALFIGLFSLFLYWVYAIGRIDLQGIALILIAGVVVVAVTTLLYRNFWD